jgi:hypothetical protein
MIKQYLAYLKDNPQGYWFKRKLYGWGWVPAKWQGWVVILVFLALVTLHTRQLNAHQDSVSDFLMNFLPDTVILFLALIGVCYMTGEPLKWQWGIKKDNDPKN